LFLSRFRAFRSKGSSKTRKAPGLITKKYCFFPLRFVSPSPSPLFCSIFLYRAFGTFGRFATRVGTISCKLDTGSLSLHSTPF
jgi:hypothetical protein